MTSKIVDLNGRRPVNATAGANSLSQNLASALASPSRVLEDGSLQTTPWKAPSSVSPDLRSEAAATLAAVDGAMRPADVSKVREWLMSLGPLVAGNMSADDARVKLDAYSGRLDYPAACFSSKALDKAARRFKFFPTYGELCDFLDAQLSEVRENRRRLQAIVNAAAGQKQLAAPEPQTLEQRQHMGALFGKLAAAIGSGNFSEVLAATDARRMEG